jgi:hypothetical protein
MGIASRALMAVASAAGAYLVYIYLPAYLLGFFSGDGFTLSVATIEIGSFEELVFLIQFLGYIIVGVTFAHAMTPKETAIKAVWRLIRVFLSITFWGIFIFADFNTINVLANFGNGIGLNMGIDMTGLFWVMMGASIFDLIIALLDFAVAFVPKED